MPDYDIITVGGGLGGAALAKVMAEKGARVLVVEREHQFKDRIRGEFLVPWGGTEMQTLGLYDALLETCANPQRFLDLLGSPVRDLLTTTPHKIPGLAFYHPAMQDVILNRATGAGAEVWRGAEIRMIKAGEPPCVTVQMEGAARELTARIVVCADGRSSASRTWLGFTPHRGKQRLFGAGVMFENMRIADDTSVFVIDSPSGRCALLFPQGHGRVRAYLGWLQNQLPRLQGERDFGRFVAESISCGMPADYFENAEAHGPLASFDLTETWVEHPYQDGVALIGDAAGASDPTWGQGLSLTARDVRVLAQQLTGSNDWDAAGHAYAEAHDEYFGRSVKVGGWFFDLFFAQGPEADKSRARAMPLLAAEPERIPDHNFSGPDLPCDDAIRRRFFGEE
ncbi:MAG: FAD-dependent monooxygenase [Deltaproteobacteria bacterium]|nr:FAD-dependent monooxygenase [Deltaproteobacteria bacterium]